MYTVEIAGNEIHLQEHPLVWKHSQWAVLLGNVLVNCFDSGMKGLELGIGSGVLAILAGMQGLQVVGLDICREAVDLTYTNWLLNGLEITQGDFFVSDCFSSLQRNQQNSFDILWSNPPSIPGIPHNRWHRNSSWEYQLAGSSGREILDIMIREGRKWICDGGSMITIASSKQGWMQTKRLLEREWKTWDVVATEDIPLPEFDTYQSLIPVWREQQQEDGEMRIFQRESHWFQRLYIIRATK